MRKLSKLIAVFAVVIVASLGPSAADGIKVGISQALSGGNADYFQRSTVDPILLAVEQVNAAGGLLGQNVEVVTEDHKGEPAVAAAVARKMIDVDHINVLTTSVSPAVLAALPICEQNDVLVLSIGQHPKITESPWGFRITATGTNYGVAMANFAWDNLHARTVALMGENNDAIRLSQLALKKRFEELGGKIVANETFSMNDQDLRAQLTKIHAAAPDVLSLQSTGPRMHGIALKQAAEMKIKFTGVIANETVTDPSLAAIAGHEASGVYFATVDIDKDWNDTVFKPRFHVDAPGDAALSYDGINKYFAAVRAVGSADPEKIRAVLMSQPASKGVTGTWGYNGTHEPGIIPVIKQIP